MPDTDDTTDPDRDDLRAALRDNRDLLVDELRRAVSNVEPSRRDLLVAGAGSLTATSLLSLLSKPATANAQGVLGSSSDPWQTAHLNQIYSQTVQSRGWAGEAGTGFLGFPAHHIEYQDGLVDEEIARYNVPAGQQLTIWAIELQAKGGTILSDFEMTVYDESQSTALASATASTRTAADPGPVATSSTGAVVTLKVRNETGSAQQGTFNGHITVDEV